MELQSMATAPKDGSSVRVQERSGYTHAFYQDGFWWWHTVNGDRDGDYACGPVPEGWYAPNAALRGAEGVPLESTVMQED